MTMSPMEIWSVSRLGYLFYERGRLDEAERVFEGLAALCPTEHYPWHALGLVARRRERIQRAVECFQRAIKLAPDAWQTRVAMAETLLEHGYERDAVEVLRPLRQAADQSSDAVRRGLLLLRRWSGS